MRMHTQRELSIWLAWLEMQLNVPDRTAFYLMQIAAETRRANVKNPGGVKIKDMLIQFDLDKKAPPRPPVDYSSTVTTQDINSTHIPDPPVTVSDREIEKREKATAISKSVWAARFAACGVRPPDGTEQVGEVSFPGQPTTQANRPPNDSKGVNNGGSNNSRTRENPNTFGGRQSRVY